MSDDLLRRRETIAKIIAPDAGWFNQDQLWMAGVRNDALAKADQILAAIDVPEAAAEIRRLREAVEGAYEALAPFARAAEDLDDDHRDLSDIWEDAAAMSITAGDLRRAKAFTERATPACSCAEVFGEDPACKVHGLGTIWGLSDALSANTGMASGPCNEGQRVVVYFHTPEARDQFFAALGRIEGEE